MSKFFRSPDSSESSTSESNSSDDEDTESLGPDLDSLSISQSQELTSSSLETIARQTTDNIAGSGWHRDLLLHALLEERCMREVLGDRNSQKLNPRIDKESLRQEASERYRTLCAQLAPLNLVSPGLDGDEHRTLRQKYRDGLGLLTRDQVHTDNRKPSISSALGRLLTEGTAHAVQPGDWRASRFEETKETPNPMFQDLTPAYQFLTPSRYLRDFDEIGVLGAGGYGRVFHVKHRLDGRTYAVKKVPLNSSLIAQVQSPDGHAAMDHMLAEVRALSQLDHPNVVRYFSSWIEWSANKASSSSSSEMVQSNWNELGNNKPDFSTSLSHESSSLHRVVTQSNPDDDIGISFDSQPGFVAQSESSRSFAYSSRVEESEVSVHSTTDAALVASSGPALALHMQMDIYPMTLADYLTPQRADCDVAPLAHCFHLEPSINILLAILDGVEYLHAEGIVHRDLKPANIFLRIENSNLSHRGCVDLFSCSACQESKNACPAKMSVRIGDFGLVTRIAGADDVAMTELGPAVGTEIYRPTAGKSRISPQLDIFAMGVIACELLCPFGTQMERRETLQKLKAGCFPTRFADCSKKQCSMITQCITSMLLEDPDEKLTIPDLKQELLSILTFHTPARDVLTGVA